LVGIVGSWFVYDAASTYVAGVRAYQNVDVVYEKGSFIWLEADYGSATADITIHNNSDSDLTVTYLALHLYFDGNFAGSRYTRWEPLDIPKGESHTVTTIFQVSISLIQHQGGTGCLILGGTITMEISDVNQQLPFNLPG